MIVSTSVDRISPDIGTALLITNTFYKSWPDRFTVVTIIHSSNQSGLLMLCCDTMASLDELSIGHCSKEKRRSVQTNGLPCLLLSLKWANTAVTHPNECAYCEAIATIITTPQEPARMGIVDQCSTSSTSHTVR